MTQPDINSEIKMLLDTDRTTFDAERIALVERLRNMYPYFTMPTALMLKHIDRQNLSDEELAHLLNYLALSAADRTAMVEFVDIDNTGWASIYPPEKPAAPISTDSAIDTFLETFGSTSPGEEALIERLIFNPTPDYSEVLEQQERENPTVSTGDLADEDAQMARIDAFIAADHSYPEGLSEHVEKTDDTPETSQAHHTPVEQPHAPDDSMLSESLAKIFIKQGRYRRAFEIITNLSLNYPEKSIYFADQLRFLQKLMLNQQFKDAKQSQKNK